VLSPILVEVAQDFDVSTATAGQLRAISGSVAAVTAFGVGAMAARVGLRSLLLGGLGTLALASALSAAAPTFAALAGAQVLLGAAVGVLLSAGIAGATAWIPRERRADALSATFSGQAVAWLVGMPLVGAVGDVSWRLAWLVLPLAASLLALAFAFRLPEAPRRPATLRGDPGARLETPPRPVAAQKPAWRRPRRHRYFPSSGASCVLARRASERVPDSPRSPDGPLATLARDRVLAAWWLGEVLAFSAWVGVLVYAGALLVDSYALSLTATGAILGGMFAAYLPGTLYFRRHIERSSQRLVIGLGLAAAVVAALIGSLRQALWLTVLLLAVYVFLNAGRTIAGSAFGLDAAPGRSVMAMGLRASAAQLGYLIGAGVGGLALHFGGYAALGAAFCGLYVLAVVPHVLMAVAGGTAVGRDG
jgi:MFS transporter, DHA1 family, inner membrane transport protein